MVIINRLDDLGFKADNLEDLKKQIEEFYNVNGYKPDVEIHDDTVVVTIDTELFDKSRELTQGAIDLCNRGFFDKAMNLLDEAQRLTPCYGDIYRIKAQIYFLRDPHSDAAMNMCIDALRFNPQDTAALTLMGNILMNTDNEAALSYYHKALEYAPTNEIAASNIAMIETQRGNYDEAISIYKHLIERGTTAPNIYNGLLVTYIKTNNLQEAFEIGVEGLKNTTDRIENPGVKDNILRLTYRVATDLIKTINTRNIFLGIKDELEEKFTMPLEIRVDNDMVVCGRSQYGPSRRENHHTLYYKENAPANALHTIIHEMIHLEMNTEATKCGKNMVLYSGDDEYNLFCKTYSAFAKKVRDRYGEEQMHKFFKMFAMLTMNTPLDLFVEQRIHDKYSILRPFQFVSLYKEAQDYVESTIGPEITDTFPAPLVRLVKICNMVTAMHIRELYGIDTVDKYKAAEKDVAQAKDLYDEFLAYQDYAPGEEYEYMEYFMQTLNVEQYITIKNEKDFLEIHNLIDEVEELKENNPKNSIDTQKANEDFAKSHPDKADSPETIIMSEFMLDALQQISKMPMERVKIIAIEIAMIGTKGIHPENTYRVPSLERTFGGYELLAYYYVSWALAFPERLESMQLPFSEAYHRARKMFNGGN